MKLKNKGELDEEE